MDLHVRQQRVEKYFKENPNSNVYREYIDNSNVYKIYSDGDWYEEHWDENNHMIYNYECWKSVNDIFFTNIIIYPSKRL